MRSSRLLHIVLAVLIAASSRAACNAQEQRGAKPELPVILLTGFEPFGPDRPPNPSWEGVKKLNGRTWRGHKLVARQVKVIWGEPLKELRKAIEELHPAAVFAFGQGGGYAIETKARNARGPIPDNNGNKPPSPEVIAGGPAVLQASIDAKAIGRALESAGHKVRLSTDAGAYLCEEMLYTLEWLKREGRITGPVSFCHVPALGARDKGAPVTSDSIQKFMEHYLEAWHASSAPVVRGQSPELAAPAAAAPATPQEQEVRRFIERYFLSWSSQDMERYGQCFMPQAAIQLIDENNMLVTMPLAPFLRSQQESHRRSANRMAETAESVEVRFDAKLAHALVYWKLVDGARVEYGYDHFTLMRSDGKWRIANLVFYATPPPAQEKR